LNVFLNSYPYTLSFYILTNSSLKSHTRFEALDSSSFIAH